MRNSETVKNNFQIDFKNLQELKENIGKLGEEYVYRHEYEKLKGTKYQSQIDKSKSQDHTNGYDILSYTKAGVEIHIEVKSTLYDSEVFYITENELSVSERMKMEEKVYKIYRVINLADSDRTEIHIISDVSRENLCIEPIVYKAKLNNT